MPVLAQSLVETLGLIGYVFKLSRAGAREGSTLAAAEKVNRITEPKPSTGPESTPALNLTRGD